MTKRRKQGSEELKTRETRGESLKNKITIKDGNIHLYIKAKIWFLYDWIDGIFPFI